MKLEDRLRETMRLEAERSARAPNLAVAAPPSAGRGVLVGTVVLVTVVAAGAVTATFFRQSEPSAIAADTTTTAPVTTIAAAAATTLPVPTVTTSPVEVWIRWSPQAELDEVFARMVSEGLSLLKGSASFSLMGADDEDFPAIGWTFLATEVVWSPPGFVTTIPSGAEVVGSMSSPLRNAWAALSTLPASVEAWAVISRESELLAFGATDSVGGFLELPGAVPFILGPVSQSLYLTDEAPIPLANACLAPPQWNPRSPQEAMLDFFRLLDGDSLQERSNREIDFQRQADRIVHSNSMLVDAVTGEYVMPHLNDVIRQLRDGVSPGSVVIRPAVPFGVEVAPTGHNAGEGEILVFIDSMTGHYLGAVHPSPTYGSSDDGSVETFYKIVVYLAPPSEGAEMHVFVRSMNGRWECSPHASEVPLIEIPYDDVAGSRRSGFDLETLTILPLEHFRDY